MDVINKQSVPASTRRVKSARVNSIRYHRVPVRLLQLLPIRMNPRLKVLDYRLTAAPGQIGTRPRTHSYGSALLSGYVVQLCFVQDGGEWFLETESCCYDEDAARRDNPDWSLCQLADLYRAAQQKQAAGEGRTYGRTAGRN